MLIYYYFFFNAQKLGSILPSLLYLNMEKFPTHFAYREKEKKVTPSLLPGLEEKAPPTLLLRRRGCSLTGILTYANQMELTHTIRLMLAITGFPN